MNIETGHQFNDVRTGPMFTW